MSVEAAMAERAAQVKICVESEISCAKTARFISQGFSP